MQELGEYLRSVREEKGLTRQDLEHRTKMRLRYIAAIEEGRLSELPGQAYVKAFLRLYGREVGLNPDQVLQRYERLRRKAASHESTPWVRREENGRTKSKASALTSRRGWQLVFLLALVGIALVVIRPWV